LALVERYADLLEQPDALVEALLRPLPQTLWANRLRIAPAALGHLLTEAGAPAQPLAWWSDGLRLPAWSRPGRHWGFLAGLFQIQEEAAMLPVRLLDPQPGERVLDLCAAPGNKTAQIAVAMANRGTVHANDGQRGRLAPLRQSVRRLGLVNVLVTARDGQRLGSEVGVFDRILIDAPCTCEGTFRKVAAPVLPTDLEIARAASLQHGLLSRAMRQLRPGGRLVYATCTFAPEENEAVVDALLREFPDELRVLPMRMPGLASAPGVTRWRGRMFDPSLAGALRVWPHQTDSGGFFAVVLERAAAVRSVPVAPAHRVLSCVPTEDWQAAFVERFGIAPEALSGLRLVRWGKRHWRLVNHDLEVPERLQPEALGLPGVRRQSLPLRPTTAAVMLLGRHATRNCLRLDTAALVRYREREDLLMGVDAPVLSACTGPGPVIVEHDGHPIGLAQLIYERERPLVRVRSLYPVAWKPAPASEQPSP
jgi:16S rRNA C967 or C1407 C5-methylase (RsmB/RsmF family)